jgi:hypothetical protein
MAAASRSARDGSRPLGSAAPFKARKKSDAIKIDSALKLQIRLPIFHVSVKPPTIMSASLNMEPRPERKFMV